MVCLSLQTRRDVWSPPPATLQAKLLEKGFFAALQTEEGYVSFCVTEKRTKAEIDALVEAVKEV